jgi:predicted secreted protein
MKYSDKRSKKIVFVSHCMINVNNKFPGYADVQGAYNEFIIPLLEAGVGLFQMPCLEVLGWGGLERKHIEFDLDRDNLEQDWIKDYPDLCDRWATWTADRYVEYVEAGYEILGVIHVGDSPTCGLEHVDEFPQIHFDFFDKGFDLNNLVFEELIEDLETREEMAQRATGRGAFMSKFKDELMKRGHQTSWYGFYPAEPMGDQATMFLKGLQIIR